MSVVNSTPLLASVGDDGYQISRSVRLRSSASAYFNRTFGTPTNNKIWSYSLWVKRGKLGAEQELLNANSVNSQFYFSSSDTLNFYDATAGATYFSTQVFRDPSAWYHIVVSVDTTQATSGNRVRIYVNGSQITAFSTGTAPTQNNASAFNAASTVHTIGRYNPTTTNYLDGYLTEVNFIDGQALTPSSFGETDTITGVWKPKKYAGTYGTNGFYLPFTGASPYYSGYFDGTGDYVTAPASSNWDFGSGDFTVEFWVNPSDLSIERKMMFHGWSGSGTFNYGWATGFAATSGILNVYANGNRTFNDITLSVNQWQHIAIVGSGGVLSAFKNGVKSATTHSYTSIVARPTATLVIGGWNDNNEQIAERLMFIGYMSNVRILKGTALYTSTFTPPTSQLNAITNTQFLSLQNSSFVDNSANAATITVAGDARMSQLSSPFSSTGIGSDFSSQGNNWTPNNISLTSGVTYDSMLDVPTPYADGGNGRGNYCVLNPLKVSNAAPVSDGNLRFLGVSGSFVESIYGTIGVTGSGKYYFEVNGAYLVGFNNSDVNAARDQTTGRVTYHGGSGFISVGATTVQSGLATAYNNTDVVGVALNLDAGTIAFYKNNTQLGTNVSISAASTWWPFFQNTTTYYSQVNFGQRPFAYTPPTGFKALNTQNLPDATIKKGNAYFDVTTYTGNASTNNIVNSGAMQPDLVWIKNRGGAFAHYLTDAVRGAYQVLYSNLTNAEYNGTSNSDSVSAFNSNGFTILGGTNRDNYNQSSNSYVAWQWKESASAGFDIVTYTGTGSATTVAHSLGVAPKLIIVKSRTSAVSWIVQHASLGATQYLLLDSTAAAATSSSPWNNTAPTSSVFSLGTSANVNTNAANYVAYLFADVAGFSKFGSYTGDGSDPGPFVYCGFRPRLVLVKNAGAASTNWVLLDTSRDAYNQTTRHLFANTSGAQGNDATYSIDILSNGFKVRNSDPYVNGSGNTIIFAAFAENPFKNSLAR